MIRTNRTQEDKFWQGTCGKGEDVKRSLSESELEKISACIVAQMGLHFPSSKWQHLEQILSTAAMHLGLAGVHECAARLSTDPPAQEFIDSLVPFLTIGETYFFREIKCFELLEKQIIPEIVQKRGGEEKRLCIWSAGCATGEEAYSIAILLDQMRDTLQDWKISILATDINPLALEKAKEGIYSNWSFRRVPPALKQRYFRETEDGRFSLIPRVKEMVTFSRLNLVADSYASLGIDTNTIDVIFCRNVFIYFTPQIAARVVGRLRHCLTDGGSLFVSSSETLGAFFDGLTKITTQHTSFCQKKLNAGHAETEKKSELSKSSPSSALPFQAQTGFRPALASRLESKRAIAPPIPLLEEPDETSASPEPMIFYEQGNYKAATAGLLAQLAHDTNNIKALTLLCRIYANEGKLDKALTISEKALAIDMLSAEIHYLRGIIFQEQGQDAESIESFKKAIYLKKDLVMGHVALANLKLRKGMHRRSQIHFNAARSLLKEYHQDAIIPEADGITARQLQEIIRTTVEAMGSS